MTYFKYLFIVFLSVQVSCNREPSLLIDSQSIPISYEIKPTSISRLFNRNTSLQKSKDAVKLISWNIRDFGGSKDDYEIQQIAQIIRDYDIVAIQEVVAKDPKGAQAVARLADALNRMGSKWDYRVSDPTQSPSVYKSERYAFLWKTARVKLLNAPYLDSKLAMVCDREPYIALFKANNMTTPFYLVNFHSRRYNDQPEEEIKHFIEYPERLQSNRVIIAGDFNLDENHEVWENFYAQGFKNAVAATKTTLKMKCKFGTYRNHAIDNIYATAGISYAQTGSVDIVGDCNQLKKARSLSDHLPIFIEFH